MWRGSATLTLWPEGSLHARGQEEKGIRVQKMKETAGQGTEDPEEKGKWAGARPGPGQGE